MAKVETFNRPGVWVQVTRSADGLSYVAWRPGISQGFGDRKTLLKWLAWPPKTPTGDDLRAWLDGIEQLAEEEPAVVKPQEKPS